MLIIYVILDMHIYIYIIKELQKIIKNDIAAISRFSCEMIAKMLLYNGYLYYWRSHRLNAQIMMKYKKKTLHLEIN